MVPSNVHVVAGRPTCANSHRGIWICAFAQRKDAHSASSSTQEVDESMRFIASLEQIMRFITSFDC